MKYTLELVLQPIDAEDAAKQRIQAADELSVDADSITAVVIRKRSIDARRGRPVVRLVVDVFVSEQATDETEVIATYPELPPNAKSVVIVGSGPAGLFAALRLIELGVRPIVLERGADVRARRRDLVSIQRYGIVNPESNYCFGEGGAGTYSDGKLYTRSTKRGDIGSVLRTLVAHGAPHEITVDAHPHIGSNKLPNVVAAMRDSIRSAGGAVQMNCRVDDFIITADKRIVGVVTTDGEVIADAVILATGHSARDVFTLLHSKGIHLEAKPFAIGVRVEHAQDWVDSVQYRCTERDPYLPAASYRLAAEADGRGVFTFCMCPGGFVVPSATAQDEVVVNGMSLSRRDSKFANSGVVASVELEDLSDYAQHGPLAGLQFQRDIEMRCAQAGGGKQMAPATRLTDFLEDKQSDSLPECSYGPGLTSAPLQEVLPAAILRRLQLGLTEFGRLMKGYVTRNAVVIGVESRTSSPVRIPRDAMTLQHPEITHLFPCGEGAGYAGGIVSAAMDGVRVAEAVANCIGAI